MIWNLLLTPLSTPLMDIGDGKDAGFTQIALTRLGLTHLLSMMLKVAD